jgi:hypothetical protein
MSDILTDRFTEYPETIAGDVSPAFVEFVLKVHPGQPYDTATAALMCRQAYELGRREADYRRAH